MTSYVYVWQTIARVEHRPPSARRLAGKIDAILRSFFAVAVCWFILIATGATLGVHHLHANTAAEAAEALRPVAGPLAGGLFAVALLASAAIALPVLIATTAYVTGAQMQCRHSLSLQLRDAPLFYAVLGSAALLGAVLALSGIPPIRLLLIAGIIGEIASPVGLILLLAVGANRTLMRHRPVSNRGSHRPYGGR